MGIVPSNFNDFGMQALSGAHPQFGGFFPHPFMNQMSKAMNDHHKNF